METKVTGCTDCPLYDNTGAEYEQYCHHPNRPIKLGVYRDAVFTETVFDSPEKDSILKLWASDENVSNDLWQLEPEIINGEDYKPITPDWCPLKLEPITITLTPPND